MQRIAQLRTLEQFQDYCAGLGINLPLEADLETGNQAPLQQSIQWGARTIGNRFTVLPMEGWDAGSDGQPTELVKRRWENFGRSGAKLIWGGEAVAVQPDGRANPHQLMINPDTLDNLAALRQTLVQTHAREVGQTDDLVVGLQLTHSGRFARPNDKKRLEPQILYSHPILNRKFHLSQDYPLISDDYIAELIEQFIQAAVWAAQIGFDFVDIKHCHGYLGHEFLSAIDRQGKYGGSFENRTRFLREIVGGIQAKAPDLKVGVRLSAFDWVPFRPSAEITGEPEPFEGQQYDYAFGGDGTGLGINLAETHAFLALLKELGIQLVCLTAGSPYYNPHIQRPALFPPSDGYQPPEDPLCGVARQLHAVAELKRQHLDLILVGSGYSYLQDWLPNVAQAVIRQGMADSIGLGRMILSYPELAADILQGGELQRKRICRTFSDCTTAPRNGLVSGCYPLDPFYKAKPEMKTLTQLKQAQKAESNA